MRNLFVKKPSALELRIEQLSEELATVTTQEETNQIIDQIERLTVAKGILKPSISADTKAIIAANLLGIALILTYEQGHALTSKALGFVSKGRI